MKRLSILLIAVSMLVGADVHVQAVTGPTTGVQIDALNGSFGTMDGNCKVANGRIGNCDGGVYMFATYDDPIANPYSKCDSHNVFPVESGWQSGPGNCEVLDTVGNPGVKNDARLARGSIACTGFALNFEYGDAGNIFYYALTDLTSQNIRFGPMRGRIWTEGPVVFGALGTSDQYKIYMQLYGAAVAPNNVAYKLTLNLHGTASASRPFGAATCDAEGYSDWLFAASGDGVITRQ